MAGSVGLVDLPTEILFNILIRDQISYLDLISLYQTCRQLRQAVTSNQLWTRKLSKEWTYLPSDDFSNLDWSEECKNIIRTHELCKETIMKYYWSNISLSDSHMTKIPDMCHTYSKLGHVYWLAFLKDLCLKQINIDDSKPHTGLYNMTNQYYASIMLDFLNQHFLEKMWSEMRDNHLKFTPERLAIFFGRWMQPECEKFDSSFDAAMIAVVKTIKDSLSSDHPLHRIKAEEIKKWSTESISENKYDPDSCMEVIKLSIDVLKNDGLFSTAHPKTCSFSIQNIIKNKKGNRVFNTIILEAVLRRCGVRLEFDSSSYLKLIWKENWLNESKIYFIGDDGQIAPHNISIIKSEYDLWQEKFLYTLAFLVKSYNIDKKNITTQRALELIIFLEPINFLRRVEVFNLYSTFEIDARGLCENIPNLVRGNGNLDSSKFRLEQDYSVIQKLDMLSGRNQKLPSFKTSAKHRSTSIKLAVGLVCHHKFENYLCVVHGWDNGYVPVDGMIVVNWDSFPYKDEPFCNVLLADGTAKYVPQNHLIPAMQSKDLKFTSKIIGKHFSHFDGYVYIPNVEKEKQYPEDGLVRDKFRNVFY